MMIKSLFIALLAFNINLAKANGFDFKECKSLGDVKVSGSIQYGTNQINLTNNDNEITVSPNSYLVNGYSMNYNGVTDYYDLLSLFLEQSKNLSAIISQNGFSNWSKKTGSGWSSLDSTEGGKEFLQASQDMCETILVLAMANEDALQQDQNFIPAVIVLGD